jgi:hypothetical protein
VTGSKMCYYVLLELLHTCSVGTEGRNRTDTVSPPPDFESGASTSSATPAQARIITLIKTDAMAIDEKKGFTD